MRYLAPSSRASPNFLVYGVKKRIAIVHQILSVLVVKKVNGKVIRRMSSIFGGITSRCRRRQTYAISQI